MSNFVTFSQDIVKIILFVSLQVWLEPTKPIMKQVRRKSAQILAQLAFNENIFVR